MNAATPVFSRVDCEIDDDDDGDDGDGGDDNNADNDNDYIMEDYS